MLWRLLDRVDAVARGHHAATHRAQVISINGSSVMVVVDDKDQRTVCSASGRRMTVCCPIRLVFRHEDMTFPGCRVPGASPMPQVAQRQVCRSTAHMYLSISFRNIRGC